MKFKILGSFIIISALAGSAVYLHKKREDMLLAQIESCSIAISNIKRAEFSQTQSYQSFERASSRLENLNPRGLSAKNLQIMKEYQRFLGMERRYSLLANAVWRARDAVESRFSLNLTDKPFNSIPPILMEQVNETFFTELDNEGYPSVLFDRQSLARELLLLFKSEIETNPANASAVNIVVIPSINPDSINALYNLFIEARNKAEFLRDDLTRFPFGMSLQGQTDLPEKIREYEFQLGVILTERPRLETAAEQAKADFLKAKMELEILKSNYNTTQCDELLDE